MQRLLVYDVSNYGFLFVDEVNFCACADSGEGGGVQTPLKSHKDIGFLSNTGPDPLKHNKATKLAFNVAPSSASQ